MSVQLVDHEFLFYASREAADEGARQLKAMGPAARQLLAECVEHQALSRTKVSRSAEALFDAGFLFIRETGSVLAASYQLSPSILGEETLLALEMADAAR